jgi:LmbE family N-acetylglucosaminyl deacetylase
MTFTQPTAEWFIPDGTSLESAISRTTHMAIGAHQDDLEIMAYHGIVNCFQQQDKFFSGVVVTNGSGSARDNVYKDYTDDEMIQVRRKEQKKAAVVGEFGSLALLDHPSKDVKDPANQAVIDELVEIITQASPEILYTHNLADKHDTHIGVVTKVITALRKVPKAHQPNQVFGCEVWRDLDWVLDEETVAFDVSAHPNLASSLVEIFDSQIIGGKRYDLATIGRRLANATFRSSHTVDERNAVTYAMDLTPLMLDPTLDITTFITGYIDRFKRDVENRIQKVYSK